jgi:drug/metabolite transporter (DMT)-like permease
MTDISKDRRLFGLVVVLLATIMWSTAGVFVRLIHLDVWTVLGWRSLFAAMALIIVAYVQNGTHTTSLFLRPTKSTLLLVPIATINMGAYVVALKLTSVANVMIVYATVPLVAAGLAFLILGERTTKQVLGISLIALAGVVIMVGGTANIADFSGSAVALLMTFAMGLQIVIGKNNPGLDMCIINALGCLVLFAVGMALSKGGIPSWHDMLLLAAFGVSNTALAYYFVFVGARHILPAEVGLIGIVDVVLGPFWVWLLFNEIPGNYALVGGAVVLAAVCYFLFTQVQSMRKPR